MSAQQALRFFVYWPIGLCSRKGHVNGRLTILEIHEILHEARCKDSNESWQPYKENIRSPLLIYDD